MTDQLQSTTSTATTGTNFAANNALPIPLPGPLSSALSAATSTVQSTLDKFLPPSKRASIKDKLTSFAQTRPLLASFLLSQIALSGLPLALFVIMSVTVVVFALVVGVLVGVLGALFFIVLALGFALFVLLPTLAITTFFAVAVWLWGVGAYYIVKWFNEQSVPGVHKPLVEGVKEKMGGWEEVLSKDDRGGEHSNGHAEGEEEKLSRQRDDGHGGEQQHQKMKIKHRKVKTPDRFSSKNSSRPALDAADGMADAGAEWAGIAV